MQIQVHDQADANIPVKISGVNVIALYNTGANMSYMSYESYMKLKDLPSLKMVSSMLVCLATGCDLCPRISML